jgi:hypothetical protein
MKIRPLLVGLVTAAAVATAGTRAQASTISFTLLDIGTFPGYTTLNTGQTFTGDGFLGLYEAAQNGSDQFAHLFGVEIEAYSRTVSQTNVSSLAGKIITNATVSFDLLSGTAGPQPVTVTGFAGTGALGWIWNAPGTNYGQVVAPVVGGSNTIDVTSLLIASLLNGDTFFNMHFQGSTDYMWTYTYQFASGTIVPDAAHVRLNVEVQDPTPIPEPATLALLGVGVAALAARRRSTRTPAR